MSTIHLHETTTSTPEQFVAGAALKRGFRTRDAEMDLARLLGELPDR